MKARLFTMLLFLLIAVPACTATRTEGPTANDEAAIRALENQGRLAVLKMDFGTMERIWSDRFMVNAPNNMVAPNRSAVFAGFRQGIADYSSFEHTIERILMDRDVVIVMGAETVKPIRRAPMAGQTVHRRFTHVWTKEGRDWRLLARHANIIPSSAARY